MLFFLIIVDIIFLLNTKDENVREVKIFLLDLFYMAYESPYQLFIESCLSEKKSSDMVFFSVL